MYLPTYDDVVEAARRLDGHALHTPVMRSRTANTQLGAAVFFKCENLQRTGAFKFRGAFNALSKNSAASNVKRGCWRFHRATTRRPWPWPPISSRYPPPS